MCRNFLGGRRGEKTYVIFKSLNSEGEADIMGKNYYLGTGITIYVYWDTRKLYLYLH